MPERRKQILECMRELDEGMFVAGTVDHVSQMDVPRLLWWLCKAVLLLLTKEVKNAK